MSLFRRSLSMLNSHGRLRKILSTASLQPPPPPNTVMQPAVVLVALRRAFAEHDGRVTPLLLKALDKANKLLDMKPLSVLDKPVPFGVGGGNGSSGIDMHDYYSIKLYQWPNPNTADGLPWISRDCKPNPANRNGTDSANLMRTVHAVEALAFAYFLTLEERYADKAAHLVDVWFLDAATRMNPNLDHAQGIPGAVDGTAYGVIEGRHLVYLCDALAMLSGSHAWTPAKQAAMSDWLGQYYQWLRSSRIAMEEKAHQNNHGTWYDVQVIGLALSLGKLQEARQMLREVLDNRIAKQIEPDGRQPLELARPDPVHYTHFNFGAFARIAELGRYAGVDLWSQQTPDGRSLCAAKRALPMHHRPRDLRSFEVMIAQCVEQLKIVTPDPCP